ncbi:MAG: polysaccharide export protein [Burkholderiales bacterium]|nr:polysaccharide export protein [Burkholderiales bacterium]
MNGTSLGGRVWQAVTLLFFAALLTGCMSSPFPPAPAMPEGGGQVDYIIGAGDTLNINVWRNPELSMSVPVRPDGRITTPLVEDIPATGQTPTQLARSVEKALAKYIQDPVVTVIVTGFRGPLERQVRVVGQAAKPQALPYSEKMTLLDVMIAVGGITEFADGNKATILRGADKPQQFTVRLRDLVKYGDVSANVEMRPGDVLIIPESFF